MKIIGFVNQNADGFTSPKTPTQGHEGYNKWNPEVFKLKLPRFSLTLMFSVDYSWPPPQKLPVQPVAPQALILVKYADLSQTGYYDNLYQIYLSNKKKTR